MILVVIGVRRTLHNDNVGGRATVDELIYRIKEQFEQRSHIAHGFDHVERVAKIAHYIAQHESFDSDIAEVAGYLHDIGRTVQEEEKDHGPAGVEPARRLLDEFSPYDDATKKQILKAIRDHSLLETEGGLTHIVQDADMLDGMGFIGIMRAYTSKFDLPCYDASNIAPTKGKRNATIHEQIAFQMEWVDFMHTDTAKKIARLRYQKMQEFLQGFEQEVLGNDFS
ncbi:HD domain-containing protein [Candidatus Saccharibacteria bacterium]|nr:MAG: HD domain-containing protein [Candidatus Saccharibacteria bacterium]